MKLLLRRTDFQRLVARWPGSLSDQFAHKDNHGEMAAGAKQLKLAAQREHDASGRLGLFQRRFHELLHRGAELLTRAHLDDRSPMSRGASYGASGTPSMAVKWQRLRRWERRRLRQLGGGVEASASRPPHAGRGAAAPGGRRFTLSDPMAC